MINPLVLKLEQFTRLSAEDRAVITEAAGKRVRTYAPREDVIREGERPQGINLFLTGWACRYKHLRDGRRQIVAIFLPGDLCDQNVFILREMDHSIVAVTTITVAELSREAFDQITRDRPRLIEALWWESLVTAAVHREWIVSLGQRDAIERVAHLFCELFVRLSGVGLTSGDSCDLPLTQADLGDALGLSAVHINRTLQELRGRGLLSIRGKRLTILDLPALMTVGLFRPNYLHMASTVALTSDTFHD